MKSPKPVTTAELDEYLQGLGVDGLDGLMRRIERAKPRLALKDIPSSKALLAKRIGERLAGKDVLFIFEDWGVYPLSRVPGLVERIRQSVGITAPIIEARGEIIPSDFGDYLLHLLAATLYSYDGCIVLACSLDCGWFISHDEFVVPLHVDRRSLAEAIEDLAQIGVKQIDRRVLT